MMAFLLGMSGGRWHAARCVPGDARVAHAIMGLLRKRGGVGAPLQG